MNYEYIQKIIRLQLNLLLNKNNGLITAAEYSSAFKPKDPKQDKLKLRLFKILDSGKLEWKSEINTVEILAQKMARDEIPEAVLQLFDRSREPQEVAKFPHIVKSNRKNLYRDDVDFPVFGFDILVRCPTEFSSGDIKSNNFNIARHAFAYVIHADENSYMLRAIMGDSIMNLEINNYLDKEMKLIYDRIKELFYNEEYEQLAYELCEASNEAIKTWTFRGV